MATVTDGVQAPHHGTTCALDEVAQRIAKHPRSARTMADVLAEGGVVLAHSELGYLLCADALDRAAVRRAVGLKQDGVKRPLGIVTDPDDADRYAVVGRRARRLMVETWPGTLGLHLPHRRSLPSWSAAGGFATLLCPDAFFWRVAWTFGSPIAVALVAPRACAESAQPGTRIAAAVDLVVDGGRSPAVEQTVIDLTTARPRVACNGGLFAPQRLQRLVPDLA
jgi:tRNA A37 threonylcarbamoyladenosine synthetase subunit TsaC/SUA5/YrdC